MKTFKHFQLTIAAVLIVFTVQSAIAGTTAGRKRDVQQGLITLKGKVVDSETGSPLVFASISVMESNVATVTNIDGEFIIKISEPVSSRSIQISFLGYKNKVIPISEMRDNGFKNIISMETAPIPIQEVIVKPMYPYEILEKAISQFEKNYPTIPNLMTAFYRETIRKNRTYVSIGEAVVEIFKAPYENDMRFDGVKIYKGRKSTDVEKMDTVLFKLQGGPVTVLELDIVKNPEAVLTREAMKYYDYKLVSVVEIDDRPHYVIQFIQKPEVEIPLFMGKYYIDINTYAITEIEFGFNLSDKEAATSIFIRKKPLGMSVTPEIASYRTIFREQDGKWYFAYSRAEVRFKVNWKRKLFNTNYTTMSEIAITDRTDQEVIKFAGKDKVRYADVFSEQVQDFSDPEYWGDYNVIEPDQSIESAIRRLSKKLKFSDREELQNK